MSERGSLLIGLMMSGVILSFATVVVIYSLPRYSTDLNSAATDALEQNSDSGDGTPADAIKQASKIKVQADLKSLQTSMMAFYAEQGEYPSSIQELNSFMGTQLENTQIVYVFCSIGSVIIYYKSADYPAYVFSDGQSTSTNGSSPPSCN